MAEIVFSPVCCFVCLSVCLLVLKLRWSCLVGLFVFYRAMHYSEKRGLAIACRLSVRLSVTLVNHDHIGGKSWKLIVQAISPTSLLFVAQRSATYSQGNMGKFGGENVR